ncbi:MAG: phosphoribosylpyrophosphate synthetase [Bacteroidota bacterium]
MEVPANRFDTLTEAIADMKERGYSLDFNLAADYIYADNHTIKLEPTEFEVAEYHRFEGDTDPADMSIVYGIVSNNGLKGVLVNAYGPYATTTSDALVSRLNVPEHKIQSNMSK